MNLQARHYELTSTLSPSVESLFFGHNANLINSLYKKQKVDFHSSAAQEAFYQGIQYAIDRNWKAAIEAFRRFVKLEHSPESYFFLGTAYHLSGEYNKAAENLEKAVKRTPNNYDFQRCLGMTYIRSGKLAKALKHIKKAIEIESNRPEMYIHLGYIQSHLFRWQLAIEAYETAINLNKKEPMTYLLLSQVYADVGLISEEKREEFFHKAIENLKKYLKFDPSHITGHNNLAYLYYCLGRLEDAEKVLAQVLKLDPNNKEALNQLRLVKEDQLAQRLFDSGHLKKLNKRITDFTPYQNRKPIKIKGKPLSETVIEDRR
jgi:tetratricopeptide (TPR) repeat protein